MAFIQSRLGDRYPVTKAQILDFDFKPSYKEADFIVATSNSKLWDLLNDTSNWPDNRFILVGPSSSGKTHLAKIWEQNHNAHHIEASEFSAEEYSRFPSTQSIIVENLEDLSGFRDKEEDLFQLCNTIANENRKLLITSALDPKEIGFEMPDLRSRLLGSRVGKIHQPDAKLLSILYRKLFSDKQINYTPDFIQYIVKNGERSFAAAHQMVNELDRISLISKRPVNKKMVRELLSAKETEKKKSKGIMVLKNPKRNTSNFLFSEFPTGVEVEQAEIEGSKKYFNRELSWLHFNWRVLEESQNPAVPLLERVRFLSISATNFDEFYSVRVAGLMELASTGNYPPGTDGRLPSEQLIEIEKDSRKLLSAQIDTWNLIREEMEEVGILILDRSQLTTEDKKYLDKIFINEVFPVLTPLAIDPAHPFPFIPNASFTIAIRLERAKDKKQLSALLPIPVQINRFMLLPDGSEGEKRFIPLEELLLEKVHFIFPEYKVVENCIFRVLRDSDLEIEEEAEDLVREFETALKRRRRGEVIQVSISQGSYGDLRKKVLAELQFSNDKVTEIPGMIGMADLSELVLEDRQDLLWSKFTPRVPERVQEHNDDIFAAVKSKDMLLHHPYETFDMVIRFIRQAAQDPNVVAIKQTLYRTSYESPIVAALCEAAENGKSVTALVELKARFDEAANIRQSRALERAGAHVVYGFINLKTHAKVSSVIRREGNLLVTYTHFGTGNYHPITAKVYTDVSLFTCDQELGRDGTKLFNYVSGYAVPDTLECLSISPFNLRETLQSLIAAETDNAKKGKPAQIWAKMNALIDPLIIDALYEASQAGVKISLVVRGICGLRPGIKGLSENIRVKSIVGRFLEHSRLFCFSNGNTIPSAKARIFISSADWMERNLDRRVETLVEIKNKTVRDQIMSQILAANLSDQEQSWVLQPYGNYVREKHTSSEELFNCHSFFMENPSLSGRGSAGAKKEIRLLGTKE